MLEKLKLVEARYEELLDRSQRPDFYEDPQKAAKILKELEELRPWSLRSGTSKRRSGRWRRRESSFPRARTRR